MLIEFDVVMTSFNRRKRPVHDGEAKLDET
jgi:hypothetical protein